MTYTNSYNASDISEIVIDFVASVAVGIVGFVAIFGLIMAYRWAKKRI